MTLLTVWPQDYPASVLLRTTDPQEVRTTLAELVSDSNSGRWWRICLPSRPPRR